ncbi:MAG: outer membrane protein assembly factor BamD [Actinomycetota bacterium]
MYTYRKKYRLDPGSIFFIVLFILTIIGMGYLIYIDKGKFWDLLPFVSIPAIVISLVLIIFNFIRRTIGNTFFIFFFILFLTGLILSNIFGPIALIYKAEKSLANKNYEESIGYYKTLLNNYPSSRLSASAMENISFAYYSNKDYLEAIDSYKNAIDSEIFTSLDLKINNILVECHSKLAEEYYEEKEYGKSAESYLDAVEILEEIKINFPATNDAFIAIYKIPEHLYNAALNFDRDQNWDKSIETLDYLISDYNDSDYFDEAGYLFYEVCIKKSTALVESHEYVEGVETFLNILNFDGINNKYNNVSDYEKKRIFSSIPSYILKDIALDNYNSGNYRSSLFLCEIIASYNPQQEEEVGPLLIDSKINLVSSMDYNPLEPPDPERKFWGPEKSILTIENNTEFVLTIYLKGPEYKIIRAEQNSTVEIEISAGTYEAVSESSNPDILPDYGNLIYEEGQRYRYEYLST